MKVTNVIHLYLIVIFSEATVPLGGEYQNEKSQLQELNGNGNEWYNGNMENIINVYRKSSTQEGNTNGGVNVVVVAHGDRSSQALASGNRRSKSNLRGLSDMKLSSYYGDDNEDGYGKYYGDQSVNNEENEDLKDAYYYGADEGDDEGGDGNSYGYQSVNNEENEDLKDQYYYGGDEGGDGSENNEENDSDGKDLESDEEDLDSDDAPTPAPSGDFSAAFISTVCNPISTFIGYSSVLSKLLKR